jgi:ammonia channel protein AmtB
VKTSDLMIAANTVWVVFAAVLVMFMQAGFAFLEAGLTRMKNAAHIAGKNVLIFGLCSLVYWAVGFGLAFGDGNALVGTSGFAPSVDALLAWVIGVEWQKQGFASEAVLALVEWLRAQGVSGVAAHIHPAHVASGAVAARAGLEPTEDEVGGEQVWRSA